MMNFWYAMIIISGIFIVLILPICMLWSENAIEKWHLKLWHCVKWESLILIISMAVLFISYIFLNKASIPLDTLNCDGTVTMAGDDLVTMSSCTASTSTFTMTVSFPVYVVCIISFLGWFLFILFAGVGLASFPIDCFCEFRH
jgi:LMBR1 domain-containing protein 1